MKFPKRAMVSIGAGCMLVMACALMPRADAGEGSLPYRLPRGVYLDISKAFYGALQRSDHDGDRIYSNTMSDEYLRQIAVSTKFTVQTNLEIIRQQERIIQLLRAIQNKGK